MFSFHACAFLFRTAEAAALLTGDVEVPVDKVSGQLLNAECQRRSKTDHDGQGRYSIYLL